MILSHYIKPGIAIVSCYFLLIYLAKLSANCVSIAFSYTHPSSIHTFLS